MKNQPLDVRFNASIDKSPNEKGCWIWTASKLKAGYGKIRNHYKHLLAHRVSYQINNGEIPPGMFVCHSCDNPSCVNPAHLFLGSRADNEADKVAKGRQIKGESHHKSKLNDSEVLEIRKRIKDGETCRGIAKIYNVDFTLISLIGRGKIWKHLN